MHSVGHRNTEQQDRSHHSLRCSIKKQLCVIVGRQMMMILQTLWQANVWEILYVTFQNRHFVEENNCMLSTYINRLFYDNTWLAVR